MRESLAIVIANLLVSFFQTLNAKTALAQTGGQRFSVAESWLIVIRLALLREYRALFEMGINKHIDFSYLIVYARHRVVLL